MQSTILKSALFFAVALATPHATARDDAPEAVLSAVTAEVMSILKHDSENAACTVMKASDQVEASILPLFDFPRMTQAALARNWRLASPEQQARLTAEFKTLLARTYAAGLSRYRDREIEFKRARMSPGDAEAKVRSEAKLPGRDAITIDYDVERTPTGWKVFDIKMGGVSVVTTYRETFADVVRDDGVDGLIRTLAARNQQADYTVKPAVASVKDQTRFMFAMLQSALQGRR